MAKADGTVKNAMEQVNVHIAMGKVNSLAKHVKGQGFVVNARGVVKYGVLIAKEKESVGIVQAKK